MIFSWYLILLKCLVLYPTYKNWWKKACMYGLKIKMNKMKCMIFGIRKKFPPERKNIQNMKIERVGVLINDQWDPSREIKCLIEMGRYAFFKNNKVLISHDVHTAIKTRFIKCCAVIRSRSLDNQKLWWKKIRGLRNVDIPLSSESTRIAST